MLGSFSRASRSSSSNQCSRAGGADAVMKSVNSPMHSSSVAYLPKSASILKNAAGSSIQTAHGPSVTNGPRPRPGPGTASLPNSAQSLSFDVQLMFLTIFCPCFLQGLGLIPRCDFESHQRQNHSAHANARLGCRSRLSAFRARDDCSLNMPDCSDLMEHFVQLVPQVDKRRHRHLRLPFRTQSSDHLRESGSLRIARGHRLHSPRRILSRPFLRVSSLVCTRRFV